MSEVFKQGEVKCNSCGTVGKPIKRRNYPHGKKSESLVTKWCRNCGKNIPVVKQNKGGYNGIQRR